LAINNKFQNFDLKKKRISIILTPARVTYNSVIFTKVLSFLSNYFITRIIPLTSLQDYQRITELKRRGHNSIVPSHNYLKAQRLQKQENTIQMSRWMHKLKLFPKNRHLITSNPLGITQNTLNISRLFTHFPRIDDFARPPTSVIQSTA